MGGRVELEGLREEIEEATDALHAKVAELLDLTERIEELTMGTSAWYVFTRARVEARPCWSRRRS